MNQADAERIVAQIASGKDPFTAPGKSLTDPTLNPEVVRALCMLVVGTASESDNRRSLDNVAKTLAPMRPQGLGLEEYLQQVEKVEILAALEASRWNKTKAAETLGITFRALRYKLENLGMEDDKPDGAD